MKHFSLLVFLIATMSITSCRKCTTCTGTWVSSAQPYEKEQCGSTKKVEAFEANVASDSTIIKNVICRRTK